MGAQILLPGVQRALVHADRIAYQSGADTWTYQDLVEQSGQIACALLDQQEDLNEARVAFLVPPGFFYAAVQWGIWRAGGVAVPLSFSATEPELEYTLSDSQVSCVIVSRAASEKLQPLCSGRRLIILEEVESNAGGPLPEIALERRAMILYTSGTTSRPKGVVTTHANIQAQITSLIDAWGWQADDSIPLFLPLHHIHGIINIQACALWSGARIEPFPYFEMPVILERVREKAYSLFMAVPTIYVKLIQTLESLSAEERKPIVDGFGEMRLMVSGSAALPASVHEQWTALTGQKLLERYGMTEIGMALSNPYDGERRAGTVGQPLPGVDVRLWSEQGAAITNDGEPGEIQVRGPGVFLEYWNRADVTESSFDAGWFRTGDIAVRDDGYFRIMGRQSVDIIKSGGYKLSALEIEAVLLEHPDIRECAVVGVPDETWGEAVAAATVLCDASTLDLETLREWCRERLSAYKIPKRLHVTDQLPRNAMGKVTKSLVCNLFR